MDFLWCHIRVGVKVNFSKSKILVVWALHALFSLYTLAITLLGITLELKWGDEMPTGIQVSLRTLGCFFQEDQKNTVIFLLYFLLYYNIIVSKQTQFVWNEVLYVLLEALLLIFLKQQRNYYKQNGHNSIRDYILFVYVQDVCCYYIGLVFFETHIQSG